MFRMGGPIKEGVMHGIREPYRSGQLVRPGPGRPGYRGPGEINPEAWIPKTNKIPKSKLGIVSTVGKKVPFLKKPIETISRSTKDLIPRTWSKIKDIYRGAPKDKNYVPPGALTNRWYWERGIKPTGTLIAGAGKKVLPYATTGSLGYLGYQGAKGLFGGDKTIDENIDISTVIPGGPGGPPGGGDPNMRYKDPDAAKKLAAKRRDERINNLLETMGYDAAKKDAVSKALIDASQIVSDRGTLDKKNITRELINPIIAATSKRLEKPEQLNEAVRLMLTKAEIEKEMNPLDDAVKRAQLAVYQKQAKGKGIQETLAEATGKGTQLQGETLASVARSLLPGDFKVMQIKVPKNTDTLEHIIDVVKESHTNPEKKPFPPGQYVLKERIVVIDEQGNVTPLDI
jgi:hypothetical protein